MIFPVAKRMYNAVAFDMMEELTPACYVDFELGCDALTQATRFNALREAYIAGASVQEFSNALGKIDKLNKLLKKYRVEGIVFSKY